MRATTPFLSAWGRSFHGMIPCGEAPYSFAAARISRGFVPAGKSPKTYVHAPGAEKLSVQGRRHTLKHSTGSTAGSSFLRWDWSAANSRAPDRRSGGSSGSPSARQVVQTCTTTADLSLGSVTRRPRNQTVAGAGNKTANAALNETPRPFGFFRRRTAGLLALGSSCPRRLPGFLQWPNARTSRLQLRGQLRLFSTVFPFDLALARTVSKFLVGCGRLRVNARNCLDPPQKEAHEFD